MSFRSTASGYHALLGYPAFIFLWIGQGISTLGDALYDVAYSGGWVADHAPAQLILLSASCAHVGLGLWLRAQAAVAQADVT